MKKSLKLLIIGILGALLVLIVIGVAAFYSASDNQLPIEMVPFNHLTSEDKKLIPVSPKDSIVKKVPIHKDIHPAIDPNYEKNQVYAVTFNHTETDSSGTLVVFVSLDKKTVVGKGFF